VIVAHAGHWAGLLYAVPVAIAAIALWLTRSPHDDD
jgi:hypothetical protein